MENRIAQPIPLAVVPAVREVVFVSKAAPGDDEFALWLAPKLEAAGYRVGVGERAASKLDCDVARSASSC